MPTFRSLPARLAGLALAAAAAGAAACSTDVSDPSIVDPGSLQNTAAIPTLIAGATGDFAFAFAGDNGGTEGAILLGGLRADEFRNSDYFDTRIQVDRGRINVNNGSVGALFFNLNRARRSADLAATTIAGVAAADYRRAAALNLGAYTYVLLAETFCSGIPFTEIGANGTSLDYGQPLTTQQVFQIAKARFDTAVTIAEAAVKAGNDVARAQQEAYLARVGRARALVGLGQLDAAAASVAPVPDDFVYDIQYSENTARENNGVYGFNTVAGRWTVSDEEGGNGLPFVSAEDPRVPVTDAGGTGVDAATELFLLDKYSNLSASIPLADGVEARLIEAEASLAGKIAGGGPANALGRLNTLRTAAGLRKLTLQTTTAAQQRQLFDERAFWLFATGHRLGDLRRLVRPAAQGGYGFAITSVFPTGPYPKGGAPYGQEVNLPIPVNELNNPNFQQCIDRST